MSGFKELKEFKECKVRADFENDREYENYKRKLFIEELPSFLVKLKNTTLIDYASIIAKGLNQVGGTRIGRPGTEDLAKFYWIILCHENLTVIWLRLVNRRIMSLFGSDVFLNEDRIKETRKLENAAGLLFDNAYIAYLIKEFGIAQDVSNKEKVVRAYKDAIMSNDKQSQKVMSKKLIQLLVKQQQNDIQNGIPPELRYHWEDFV